MSLLGKVAGGAKKVGRFYVWTITGDLNELKENTKSIKDRFSGILHREYRNETFEQAVERLRVTDRDLAERLSHLSGIAFLYGLVAAIAFLFFLATPLSVNPLNHGMMSFGVGFMSGAKFLTTRFRMAQIRARELFGFKEWLLGKKNAG